MEPFLASHRRPLCLFQNETSFNDNAGAHSQSQTNIRSYTPCPWLILLLKKFLRLTLITRQKWLCWRQDDVVSKPSAILLCHLCSHPRTGHFLLCSLAQLQPSSLSSGRCEHQGCSLVCCLLRGGAPWATCPPSLQLL